MENQNESTRKAGSNEVNETTRKVGSNEVNESTRKAGSVEEVESTRKVGATSTDESTRKAGSGATDESTRKANTETTNDSTRKASSTDNTGDSTRIASSSSQSDMSATQRARTIQESLAEAGNNNVELFETFTLKKIVYKREKVISTSTGEAQIYLVSNPEIGMFVLKLYNRIPDDKLRREFEQTVTEVLSRISKINSPYVVKIFDFGICSECDGKPIPERMYELMPFFAGGTLRDIFPLKNRKIEEVEKIAFDASTALNLLHNEKIIHMDTKPQNLFFLDEQRTKLILGDFGISVLFTKGQDHAKIVKQERTPSYAPPEFYIIVDHIEVTPKADFYSLGISLMEAWEGISPFAGMLSEERKMMDKKQNGLDYNRNMPERFLNLVRGLTRRDVLHRWGYNEIKRWYEGEDVKVEPESYDEKKEADKEFVFDATKGLVAETPQQMAKLLLNNEEAGKKYLYKGLISEWLKNKLKRNDLVVALDAICEDKYPKNQDTGLMAAAWMLDNTLPFKSLKGKICNTDKEIAELFNSDINYYKEALSKSDDRFYAYLEAKGKQKLAQSLLAYYSKNNKLLSAYNVIYTLNPLIPYTLQLKENKTKVCKDENEIVDSFLNQYSQWTDDTRESFNDTRFMLWFYHRSNAIGEFTIYNNVLNWLKDPIKHLFHRIFGIMLNLRPDLSYMYELKGDKTYCYKAADIGAKFNEYIDTVYREGKTEGTANDELYQLSIQGWMYVYLKNRKMTALENSRVEYFNMDKHNKKASFYNNAVAAYKFVAACGVKPWYYFPKSNKRITTLEELNSIPNEEVKEQIRNGAFIAWSTLHFQENIYKKYTHEEFERAAINHLEFIGGYDSENKYYKRYKSASALVKDRIVSTTRNYNLFKTLRIIFVSLMVLPALVLLFLLVKDGIPLDGNPLPGAFWEVSSTYYWIVGGILFLIILFSGGLWAAIVGGYIGAVILYYIFYIIAAILSPIITWVAVGVLLLLLALCVYRAWGAISSIKQIKHFLDKDNYQLACVEPLAHAYLTESDQFAGSTFNALTNFNDSRKQNMRKLFKWSIPGVIIFAALLYAFISTHPEHNEAVKAKIEYQEKVNFLRSLNGVWYGKIDRTNNLLLNLNFKNVNLSGTFNVANNSRGNNRTYQGVFKSIWNMDERSFTQINGELEYKYKGTIVGQFSEDWSTLTLVYSASQGTKKMEIVLSRDRSVIE